ncbi:MAG TPA: KH domain-containing protein [Thermoplasmata archaeon]|nr:KH domain-containing protein [Thermoplasmata archaeon]
MPTVFVRIPDDRVGAAIGPGGSTKRRLEEATRTTISVDADDEEFAIASNTEGDPDGVLRARDIVLAIGRGFSPERAWRLLKDDTYLGVLDIKEVSGKRDKRALWRIRSRVIGERGRARARLEELSGCAVSVYGTTVALIGREAELARATRAIRLLLQGSEHTAVFHLLARLRESALLDEASAAPAEPEAE